MNINFLLVINKNYIKQACIVIVSVLENLNKKSISKFYILCFDFDEKPDLFKEIENKYKIKIECLNTKVFDSIFRNQDAKFLTSHINSLVTYYRLLAFKYLPSDVDKIIYLDCDVIVNCDLSKIYNFNNKIFFKAVAEINNTYKPASKYLYHLKGFEEWKKNPLHGPYFNAGIFVTDINKCKENKIYEQLMDYLNKNPNPPFADQDALNAIIGQKYSNFVEYLPSDYCVFSEGYYYHFINSGRTMFYNKKDIIKSYKNPLVIHYAYKNKPWKNRYCKQYFNLWWKYYDKFPVDIKKPNLNLKALLVLSGKKIAEFCTKIFYFITFKFI